MEVISEKGAAMYYDFVKSTIFGFRNADKVLNTDDKGRIFADIGQITKAINSVKKIDDKLGHGAGSAINAMQKILPKNCSSVDKIVKGANWTANHVNPLLIGAAGYRVVVADDKKQALKRETVGMSTMFMTESAINHLYKSDFATNIISSVKNPYLRKGIAVLKSVLFVLGSITSSTLGYKIGDVLFPKKEELIKNQKMLKETLAKLEESKTNTKEIFA